MPELPEVETVVRGLEEKIINKKIEQVDVRLPKLVSMGPETVSNVRTNSKKQAQKFAGVIEGQKFVSVKRRAKLIIMDLSGPYTLLVHLKMSGQFIYASKSNQPKKARFFNDPKFGKHTLPHKHTHVVFIFSDGSKLFYNDLRQFGYLRLVRDSEVENISELSSFGPEPFDKAVSADFLKTKAKNRKISVKQFLMDPKVIAGIGNIYSDEILFCAGVRPGRAAKYIKVAEWKKINKCIKQVLKKALEKQGSSVGDFFKVDGSEGGFGRLHKVYGRAGKKCKKCATIIKSTKLGGRTSSYCPKCQR